MADAPTRAAGWKVVGGLVAAAALVATGWGLALRFQSPAQRQAAARPPTPRAVFADVRVGDLNSEVITRAKIGAQTTESASPSAFPDGGVVTAAPVARGTLVRSPDVVSVINGSPVFAMAGSFPLYRDLTAGVTGPDVRQVQDALQAAGLPIPERELGTFGPSTQKAIAALYRNAGFEAPRSELPATESTGGAEAPGGETAATTAPPPVATAPMLPQTAVVTLRHLPATIAAVPKVGTAVGGDKPFITLASGPLLGKADVAATSAAGLSPGQPVAMELGSERATGKVASVTPSESGTAVVVTPDKPLDPKWAGQDVLSRIMLDVVAPKGLIVPSASIADGPNGTSYVLRRSANGDLDRIAVTEVGSLAGETAVVAKDPKALQDGDQVKVG